jgi:hypothetical protein
MGNDPGTTSPSAILLGENKRPGDVVRVKVRAINADAPTDDTANWIGIYRVTLQAIDPVWDGIDAFAPIWGSYASHVHINGTTHEAYIDAGTHIPHKLARRNPRLSAGNKNKKSLKKQSRFTVVPAPPGVDVTNLPTVADLYQAYLQEQRGARVASKSKATKVFFFLHDTVVLFNPPPPPLQVKVPDRTLFAKAAAIVAKRNARRHRRAPAPLQRRTKPIRVHAIASPKASGAHKHGRKQHQQRKPAGRKVVRRRSA